MSKKIMRLVCAVLISLPAVTGFCKRPAGGNATQAVSGAPAKTIAFARRQPTALQMQAAEKITRAEIKWDSETGVPCSLRASDLAGQTTVSKGKTGVKDELFAADAVAVLDRLAPIYRIQSAKKEFQVYRVDTDDLGYHHARVRQQYQGLEVVGGDLIVHFDNQNSPYQVNGAYIPDINMPVKPAIDSSTAIALAQTDLAARGKSPATAGQAPRLVIYALHCSPLLAYELTLACDSANLWRYWIDAQTGEIINAFNDIRTAYGDLTPVSITGKLLSGEGGASSNVWGERLELFDPTTYEIYYYYYLKATNDAWYIYNAAPSGYEDTNSCARRTTADWGDSDSSEFSAAYNFDVVQTYYRAVVGRNSFDNMGKQAVANVHVTGQGYDNAYYNYLSNQFYFLPPKNDAEGEVLDVCGHEFTHAVSHYTWNPTYQGESGALDESCSDIFGTIIEFYAQPSGTNTYPYRTAGYADWLFDEDCTYPRAVADRDLRDPQRFSCASYYQGTFWIDPTNSYDHGGVHFNCGVQNLFFYLLCDGGSGTNDGHTYNVAGIGIANAARLAYRVMSVYYTSGEIYGHARYCWESAARDLNASWLYPVQAAWAAVGVGETPSPSGSPLSGDLDGDGKADLISVVGSDWYVWFSSSQYLTRGGPYSLGVSGTPVTGDIDGDGKADLISVVGSNWYVWFSSSQYLTRGGPYVFDVSGTPVTGDIDGDGLADMISVSGTSWYVWFSSSQYLVRGGPYTFDVAGTPVTGDIDGDGLADIISVTGTSWYVWFSTAQYLVRGGPYVFNISGTPVTGDIDGDGLADMISVTGTDWYVWFSTAQYLVRGGPYTLGLP